MVSRDIPQHAQQSSCRRRRQGDTSSVFVCPSHCYSCCPGGAQPLPSLGKWGLNSLVCFAGLCWLLFHLSNCFYDEFPHFTLQQWGVREGWVSTGVKAWQPGRSTTSPLPQSTFQQQNWMPIIRITSELTFQGKNNAITATFNLWSNLATYQE